MSPAPRPSFQFVFRIVSGMLLFLAQSSPALSGPGAPPVMICVGFISQYSIMSSMIFMSFS